MLLEEQKQPVGEALAEPCMEQSWAPMHLTVWSNIEILWLKSAQT